MKEKSNNKLKVSSKTKGFFKGFKDFVLRGNIIDLAVAVVIGAAFGKIITSLVNDVILPPIALLLGDQPFAEMSWVLHPATIDGTTGEIIANAIEIRYGNFIQTILEFVIIAFAIYAVITLFIRRKQFLENVRKEEEAAKASAEEPVVAEVVVPEDIKLLTEIRDLLGKKNE